MSDPVVLVVADGEALQLDPVAVVWLRRALLEQLRQCHRDGLAVPPELSDLAARVAGSVRSGREGGRVRASGAGTSHHSRVILTHAEAAEKLGVSSRTVRRYVAAGRLRSAGRRVVVDVSADDA